MIKVKQLRLRNDSVLVEYIDSNKRIQRCYIPQEEVEQGLVDPKVLDMGIPYGEDWESLFSKYRLDVALLSETLHKNGIWTIDDFRNNGNKILGILIRSLRFSVGKFLQEFRKKEAK